MKVAFYFSNAHLGWWRWPDLIDGGLAASGTDSQFLHLLHRMSVRDDAMALAFFSGEQPGRAPPGSSAVKGLAEAAGAAVERGAQVIVFNNRDRDETVGGLEKCRSVGLSAIVWDHNGPCPTCREALARQPALSRLVVVSHSHADALRADALFDKVAVIYNAQLYGNGAGPGSLAMLPMRVCFLGATIPEKGFHHLVRAWGCVRKACPGAELTVIGSSKLYSCDRQTGPLGLGDPAFEREEIQPHWGRGASDLERLGIRLAGLLSPIGVMETLQTCRVAVVNPSARNGSFETFCVSAIEAQAAGCPVVGGRRLGLRETVRHGETGILIQREEDLAGAIIGLLRAPDKAAAMGAAGARWVGETFSTEKADAKWMALFRDVIEGRPNRPPCFQWRLATPGSIARQLVRWGRLVVRTGWRPFGLR